MTGQNWHGREKRKSPPKRMKKLSTKDLSIPVKKGVIARLSFKFVSKNVSKRRKPLQNKILS